MDAINVSQKASELLNLIQTATNGELDKMLGKINFPTKSFYWATGKRVKEAKFYLSGNRVYSNFTNSEGRAMRFYFYFCSPPELNPYLICGAEFI